MSLHIEQNPVVQTLRRLSIFVVVSLFAILLIGIVRLILFQEAQREQTVVTMLITLAERQRTLSQQIVTDALTREFATDPTVRANARQSLQTALQSWQHAQADLQTADPQLWLLPNTWQSMADLFARVTPSYTAIHEAALCILANTAGATPDPACIVSLPTYVNIIIGNQADYLAGMDAVSTAFQAEAAVQLDRFSAIQWIGLAMLAGVALLVWYWMRKPAVQIQQEADRLTSIEGELQSSEHRFRAIAENSSDTIVRYTPEGIRTYVSPSSRELLGYEPEELVGHSVFEQAEPNNVEAIRRLQSNLSAQSGTETIRNYTRRKNGTFVWVETVVRSIRDPRSGQIQELLGIARDITERQRAEEQIRHLAGLQKAILDSANFSIISTNLDGIIQVFNAAAERWLGYSAEEMIGKQSVAIFRDPAELVERENALPQVRQGTPYVSEVTYIRKDGSRFPVELSLTALRDETGAVTGSVGIAKDITERKLAEQYIRDSETRYYSVIEALSEGVVVYGASAKMETWNRSAERILGLSLSSSPHGGYRLLNPHWPAIGEDGKPFLAEAYPALVTLRTGEAQTNVVMGLHRPGPDDMIWLTVNSAPLYRPGETQPFGAVASFIDITEMRRAHAEVAQARDEAVEAARAKSVFLATMSHELRTPMNGIIGMIDLLVETALTDSQREMLQVIRTSGQTLLAIINDTLDYSKIEAGRMALEQQECEPLVIVENVAKLLGPEAAQKRLALRTSVDSSIPRVLIGDSVRLHQILLNLLGNAVKFTERGEVTITVNLELLADGLATLYFSVSDTGIGIAEDTCTRLFAPFIQGDDSMSRKYGGTGLGLAICKRLVDMMGGDIGVQSTIGQGSTFWFRVTLALPPSENLPLATDPLERPEPQPSSWRILLVEDNPTNQRVIALQLEKLGYTVEIVISGQQALDALAAASYDLVLMDCQMPEMDGLETTRRIRHSERRGARHILVVALTANAMDGDREKCLAAGMDDYLAKPIRLKQLEEVVTRWLPNPTALTPGPSPTASQTGLEGEGHAPTLDRTALAELSSLGKGNPAVLARLIDIFLENTPKSVAALQSALVQGDAGTLRLAAHSLKSSSASYGALSLSALCKALEATARAGEWQTVAAQIHQIESEFVHVKRALESVRQEGLP